MQTGGTNDASQEAIAGMVGNQLANRIDQAMGGELANVGTGGLAGSNTVQQGTQHANAVGNAQVDYRQLQSKEMQAIKAMAPTMAEKEGITTEEAEKRMAEELLSHLDASWAETYAANGREGDDTALNYLAEALVGQGEQYDVARSDIPVEGMAAPRAEGQDYTAEEVKQHLIGFKDEHAAEYNNRTQDGEGLLATGTDTMFSEQWQFYNQNLAADKSLSDIGDTALGALAGIMDTGAGVTQGLVDMISNPWAAAEGMSHGLQAMIYDPVGTISNIFDQRSEGQINAALDNLQGDYFGAGRTGMNADLDFALDTGLLPVGKISGLGKFSDSRMGPNDGPQFPETFTTYRVEGTLIPNHRINIDVDGGVSLVPDNSNKIWLNFGQTDRATSYFARKIDAGLPGAELKSFEVDGSFVLKLRQNAVPEQLSRQNPNSPIISADPFPDQYAVPKSYFDELIQSTIQGSGKNGL